MAIWPFRRSEVEQLSPAELRRRLIAAAASGSKRKLRNLCKQYKEQVAANVEFLCKVPDGMQNDPTALNRHVQGLGAVADCLASECDAPELWNRLSGTPDDNPLLKWER